MRIIDIENLGFSYPGSPDPTLQIESFKVQKGEHLFLFGPSGSGKTTFLEILAGVLGPSSGEVTVLGKNLAAMTPAERDRFRADHYGYIFQSFNLIPYLSVTENIELAYRLSPLKQSKLPQEKFEAEVNTLIERLGLMSYVERQVTELSVGQQQRVAVARALLGGPEIILADEPTSSLDYQHREKFIKLLFEISEAQETTVVFVSHDLSLKGLFSRSLSLPEINEVKI